jgi:hypothetical protein
MENQTNPHTREEIDEEKTIQYLLFSGRAVASDYVARISYNCKINDEGKALCGRVEGEGDLRFYGSRIIDFAAIHEIKPSEIGPHFWCVCCRDL